MLLRRWCSVDVSMLVVKDPSAGVDGVSARSDRVISTDVVICKLTLDDELPP